MDELSATIEAAENQLMRAWMRQDEREVRKLVAKNCIITLATTPIEILDKPSFIGAIGNGFQCQGFRLKEIAVREYGKLAWFVASAELELRIGPKEWRGDFMLTDLWRKSLLGRRWVLAERSLARFDQNEDFAASIRGLQLWH